MASIDDLPLDDTPLPDASAGPTTDPRGTAWFRFLAEIEDLLAEGHYTWAEETLRGIQETVERTHQVTESQRRAVGNIVEARERQASSRRYEGWRR